MTNDFNTISADDWKRCLELATTVPNSIGKTISRVANYFKANNKLPDYDTVVRWSNEDNRKRRGVRLASADVCQ